MSNTRRWNVPPYLRYSNAPAGSARVRTVTQSASESAPIEPETVEQWLAAGNEVKRCPPGHQPLSYDRFVEILANVPGVYADAAVDREPNGRRRRKPARRSPSA